MAIRQWSAKARFGADVQQGATNYSAMNDWSLIAEADSPRVQKAWHLTLENLGQIAEFCQAREIPLLFLAFPSSYQFQNIELYGIPQRVLMDFGQREGIPTVDLLPLLAKRARDQDISPFDYFLDENHFSATGSRAVADIVAPVLAARLQGLPADTNQFDPIIAPATTGPVQIASR